MLVDRKEGGKGGGREKEGLFRKQEETRMKTIKSCLADACAKATETKGGTHQISAAASLRSAVLVSGFFIHPGPKKPFLKIQWKNHYWDGRDRTSENLLLHKSSKNTRKN